MAKTRITKATILILLLFSMKFIESCRCPDDYFEYFDISALKITNMDASGEYITWNESDTMAAAAISFLIGLSDENRTEYGMNLLPSFTQAYAMEECIPTMLANQDIMNIKIYNTIPYNDVPENTDISDRFLAKNRSSNNFLHSSLQDMISEINNGNFNYYSEAPIQFYLFCTDEVFQDSIQFNVCIELSDNRCLSNNTNIIYLKHNAE